MSLHDYKKTILLVIICCTIVSATATAPAQAADRSRVLTIALFASGIGLKFGSVFVETSAQDSYNQYLSTAVQAEITTHRDDYTSKHDTSIFMSRLGIGFVGLATLIAVFDQLDWISKTPSSQSTAFRLTPSYDLRNGETSVLFQRRF